jgi:hypothetical protein
MADEKTDDYEPNRFKYCLDTSNPASRDQLMKECEREMMSRSFNGLWLFWTKA